MLEIKMAISEMGHTLGGINSTLNFLEEKIGELEDTAIVIIQNEIVGKKTKKYIRRVSYIRCEAMSSDICVFGIFKTEEKEGDRKKLEVKKKSNFFF